MNDIKEIQDIVNKEYRQAFEFLSSTRLPAEEQYCSDDFIAEGMAQIAMDLHEGKSYKWLFMKAVKYMELMLSTENSFYEDMKNLIKIQEDEGIRKK